MFSSGFPKLIAASLVAGALALSAASAALAQDDDGGWDDDVFPGGFPPVSSMPTVPGWPAGPVWSGDDILVPDDEGGWDDHGGDHGGWDDDGGDDHGPWHD